MKYFNVLGFFFVVYILVVVYSGACSPDEEGHSKLLECNRCRCRRGNWLCTKKGCLSNFFKRELPIAADLRNIPCAPNDYFQIDCNTCYCNLEQSGYLCTENICTGDVHSIGGPTTQIPLANSSILLIANNTAQIINKLTELEDNKLFSCTPGQIFKKDCNDCKCTQDGKNAICTTKNCSAEPVLLSPASSTATTLLFSEAPSSAPVTQPSTPGTTSSTTPGNLTSVASL